MAAQIENLIKTRAEIRGPNECWLWRGTISQRGYGRFIFKGKTKTAHRVSFELVKGPIPTGLVIDHMCRNKICINPGHLRAVTPKTNTLSGISVTAVNSRKKKCKRGHPLSGYNLILKKKGRACRECQKLHSYKYKSKRAFLSKYGLGAAPVEGEK